MTLEVDLFAFFLTNKIPSTLHEEQIHLAKGHMKCKILIEPKV